MRLTPAKAASVRGHAAVVLVLVVLVGVAFVETGATMSVVVVVVLVLCASTGLYRARRAIRARTATAVRAIALFDLQGASNCTTDKLRGMYDIPNA